MQMKSRHVRIRSPEYGWYRYNPPSTLKPYVPILYNRTTTEKKRTSYFGEYKGRER